MPPMRALLFTIVLISALVSFVAAAHTASIRDEGIIANEPASAYLGSDGCYGCHPSQYSQWSKTLKARFVRYREGMNSLPGDWDKSPINPDEVFLVVGLNRKVAFVDNDWKVFPVEYSLDRKKWRSNPNWAKHDYRQQCGMCHMTANNPYDKRFIELGVGCETCHGPGKRHAQTEHQKYIFTPGRHGDQTLETCRRCHNDRNNHAQAIKDFGGIYHLDEEGRPIRERVHGT